MKLNIRHTFTHRKCTLEVIFMCHEHWKTWHLAHNIIQCIQFWFWQHQDRYFVAVIDGNYRGLTIFLSWQWYFTHIIREVRELLLTITFLIIFIYIFIYIFFNTGEPWVIFFEITMAHLQTLKILNSVIYNGNNFYTPLFFSQFSSVTAKSPTLFHIWNYFLSWHHNRCSATVLFSMSVTFGLPILVRFPSNPCFICRYPCF